jgi:hypothetical protein
MSNNFAHKQESPLLADITTCMVPVPIPGMPGHFKPCGQKFSAPRIAIIGDDKARLNSYLEGLAKHLGTKHPEVGQMMVQAGAAFMEMLFLRNFKTTDPELSDQQDRMRWQVHQQTLKARYPDENIYTQADWLALALARSLPQLADEDLFSYEGTAAELAERFTPLLTEAFVSIRDALEEPGKYPAPGSEKVLV